MKRRPALLILLIAAVSLLTYFGWLWFIRDSERAYFVQHSEIKLPFKTANVVHFTEFEFAFTSHYTLLPQSRTAFLEKNRLTAITPKNWAPIFRLGDLPTPWNQMPTSGTFYYFTGADSSTAWDGMFHLESGSLWTSIYYPDYSGDLPPRVTRPPAKN